MSLLVALQLHRHLCSTFGLGAMMMMMIMIDDDVGFRLLFVFVRVCPSIDNHEWVFCSGPLSVVSSLSGLKCKVKSENLPLCIAKISE